jgi:RNA polymerase sigma-70 factor (ECF subfamily)
MSREIVMRAQQGDREAFGELARLYAPVVTGAILSRVGRFRDAEDMVQETFLRALQQIGSLRDPDRIGAWLYGIALNVVREQQHKGLLAELLPAEAAEPAQNADPGLDMTDVRGCLEKLPEALREIFVLRHIQGMSYKELGQVRNASITSVGERLWKARRLLRSCLESQGVLGAPGSGR